MAMPENFNLKDWIPIVGAVFSAALTAYLAVQSGISKAYRRMDQVESTMNNRVNIVERDIKYLHEGHHELKGRVSTLESRLNNGN